MVVIISYTIRRGRNSNDIYRLQNLITAHTSNKNSRFVTNNTNVQQQEYFSNSSTLSSLTIKRNLFFGFHPHHYQPIQQQHRLIQQNSQSFGCATTSVTLQQKQQQRRLLQQQQLYQSLSCVSPNELMICLSSGNYASTTYSFDRSFSTNSNNKQDETKITKQQEQQDANEQTKHIDDIKSGLLEPLPKKVIPLTDEIRQSDEYQKRHLGIIVHPNSINNYIIPINHILKRKSSSKKNKNKTDDPTIIARPIELEYGYFWMIKDLERCNNKPILSNTSLIPEKNSLLFPSLPNVSSLGTVTNNNISTTDTSATTTTSSTSTGGFLSSMFSSLFPSKSSSNNNTNNKIVTLPDYFVRKNRSNDPNAHCTIVFISFRDYGYQQIKLWQEQILQQQMNKNDSKNSTTKNNKTSNDRIEQITLHISEGYIIKNLLQSIITAITRSNTKPTLYDTTFLYFSNGTSNDPIESFRDSLRLHNTLVGYILLVDGIGRVRYAASGVPSSSDISQLLQLANNLTPSASSSSSINTNNADISTTTNNNILKKTQQKQYHNNSKRRR